MNPRQNAGPDYFGFFMPFLVMATLIYWIVN